MKKAIAIGLACVATAGTAKAETRCARIEGGTAALESVDAEARLGFIRAVLRDQGSRASTWRWTWSGIGLGLATAQYTLVPFAPANKRFETAFEGTASLYIPLSLAVFPLRVREQSEILERAVADATTDHGIMAPCLVLDHAEERLVEAAREEAQLTSVLMHVTTIVLSAGYGAIIAVAFRDALGVAVNGGGAIVLGELQILTTPTGAVKALERYRRGDVPAPAPPRVSWSLAPLGTAPGVSIVGRF